MKQTPLLAASLAALLFSAGCSGRDERMEKALTECLKYTPPARQVVYEEDPTAAAALLASNAGYVTRLADNAPPPHPIAGHVPDCWDEFLSTLWNRSASVSAILFLHERAAPNGERRLVAVELWRKPPRSHRDPEDHGSVSLRVESYKVGTPTGWPLQYPATKDPVPSKTFTPALATNRLRFFAGEPDPADPTRFTIACEIDGQPATLEAQLTDPGPVRMRVVHQQGR